MKISIFLFNFLIFVNFINAIDIKITHENSKDQTKNNLENKSNVKKKKISKFRKYITYALINASKFGFASWLLSKRDSSEANTIFGTISGGIIGLITKYIPKKYRHGLWEMGIFFPIFYSMKYYYNK